MTPHEKLISGLFQALPAAGSEWSQDEREVWLELAGTIFKYVYRDTEEDPARRGDSGGA